MATAKGNLDEYMGSRVEFQNQLWEILSYEYFLILLGKPYRDTKDPIGFIVRRVDNEPQDI